VKQKYGDKVSVVYRHFPLPMHKQAHRAAQAAQCAHEQDGFWKFHDALFADQKAWTDTDYAAYAKSAGLDADKLVACVESGRHAATVDADVKDGRNAGMGGTPGFYINGVVLTGAQPLPSFVDVIDAELARR
jgi:protein-disulfide isomerase